MANFIKLEAQEKANELKMKAQAEADLDKQMTVMNAKTKLAEDYDRKEKALAMEQKIKASMEERRQRSRLLGARDELLQKLNQEAKARLVTAASSNATAYSNLLKGLIKQGLNRLSGENKINILCRPQDLAVVQKIGPVAAQEVVAEARAAGAVRELAVTVEADQALGTSAGGVVLSALEGRIRCNNLLEERLTLALNDLTPVVRDLLFPASRAEVRTKPEILANPHADAPKLPGEMAATANAWAARMAAAAAASSSSASGAGKSLGAGAQPAADPFAF